jgi:hypothetical protein
MDKNAQKTTTLQIQGKTNEFEFWSCVVGKKSCVVGKKSWVVRKSRGSKNALNFHFFSFAKIISCFSKTRVSDQMPN